jgi:hypothetical protein
MGWITEETGFYSRQVKFFYSPQRQTEYGAHPFSYIVGARDYFSGVKTA